MRVKIGKPSIPHLRPDQLRMPRLPNRTLELFSPRGCRGDGRVERRRIRPDAALSRQLGERRSRCRVHPALEVPIVHPTTTQQARAKLGLESRECPEESIDRTPGRAGRRLIDADGQEPAIPPLSSARERRTMRIPLIKEPIDGIEQAFRRRLRELARSAKNPDARVVRE